MGARRVVLEKMACTRRLNMELQRTVKNLKPGYAAGVKDDNIMIWEAFVPGEAGTPWEGGTFRLQLQYPMDYPFKPPKVHFETPLYHPNFNKEGNVCLELLKDKWAPAVQIDKILYALTSLMANPEPSHALEPTIAAQYVSDRPAWEAEVRRQVAQYAAMDAAMEADIARLG